MAKSGTKLAAVRVTPKGATIHKTNERPGTRAQNRFVRVSASKAREVLDLIRGLHIEDALDLLRHIDRAVAEDVTKTLESAIANAANNDGQDPETLHVSACYADEGPTLKRWRPRARGRATPIRKRTCHITIIVSRLDDEKLRVRTARQERVGGGAAAEGRASRRARVARSREADAAREEEPTDEVVEDAEVEETEAVDTPEAATEADPADGADDTEEAAAEAEETADDDQNDEKDED